MAEEYNTGSNWWDSSTRNRFDSTGSSSSSSGLNSFGWPSTEMVADVKTSGRSTLDSVSVSDSSVTFHDTQKLQLQGGGGGGGGGHDSSTSGHDHHLNLMGLGLSSQALLRGEKEGSFRSMLQENLSSSPNYQQESGIGSSHVQWREKIFTGLTGDSTMNDYKHINRGFSLDQSHFSPHGSSNDSTVTCQGLQSSFQMDSAAIYGSPPTMLQALMGSDHQPNQSSFDNRPPPPPPIGYPYGGGSYGGGISSSELLPASWAKVPPHFLPNSPPKQPPHSQLQFSNNAPFWNASASSMNDVRSSFFPSMQPPYPTPNFEEKPKNISEVRDSSSTATPVKKSGGSETSTKRPRNETTSTLPAFKVRKEKMGDRITALQQLVSPFGKTDTASVLSEAIEYIKFLHEQVSVLSTPYMKSGAPIHHQQGSDKSKDPEGQKQDLRSRGLCLVPVSSTFPVTHETTVDFWTPTFGGTYR